MRVQVLKNPQRVHRAPQARTRRGTSAMAQTLLGPDSDVQRTPGIPKPESIAWKMPTHPLHYAWERVFRENSAENQEDEYSRSTPREPTHLDPSTRLANTTILGMEPTHATRVGHGAGRPQQPVRRVPV